MTEGEAIAILVVAWLHDLLSLVFLLPIKDDRGRHRTFPYMTAGIVALNILVYLLVNVWLWHRLDSADAWLKQVEPFVLVPADVVRGKGLGAVSVITSAFLHADVLHIAGNMFFLHLFGRNVNDKLGNISYISFYLAGAVFSGIGHVLVGGGPVLGASGAVAAVTGAYLVLFPRTLITVFYWLLYFIDTFEISALYFIGLKLIVWDNIVERSVPNVAYDTHLSGDCANVSQFRFGFDIEIPYPCFNRLANLLVRLTDARIDHFARIPAGLQHSIQLPTTNHIESAAQLSQYT